MPCNVPEMVLALPIVIISTLMHIAYPVGAVPFFPPAVSPPQLAVPACHAPCPPAHVLLVSDRC